MDALDREIAQALRSTEPTLSSEGRDALLESLTARIDARVATSEAGASAVGSAADRADGPPAPDAAATAPVIDIFSRKPGRRAAGRAAGIGVGGWLAIAAGSVAAAAAGIWAIDEARPDPVPTDVEGPIIVDVRADHDGLPADRLPDITAVALEEAASSDSVAPPAIEVVLPNADEQGGTDDGDGRDSDARSSAEGDGASGERSGGSGSAEGSGQGGSGSDGAGRGPGADGGPALEGEVDVGGVDDLVEDAVDAVVPDGPLADTIAPVIEAINVNGLASWVVDSLLCGQSAPVGATVTDAGGVKAVTYRVTTAAGHTQTVGLSGGGSSWSGLLSPITSLDLGLLNRTVSVRVTATDHAGNVSVKNTQVKVGILSCLG
ncbi:hypothetical protein [Demequina sp. NBRC 110053]|uniref:hypothetical protein n=1 Tax=Demequina sp. NBRC 110053 TaxID=1570342 RepID=UPI000A0303B5|nr:hypothetical protein [Demequina sp. NBRC 110053]